MKVDLRLIYNDEFCPVCNQQLTYNSDYTKINCVKPWCEFNTEYITEVYESLYVPEDKIFIKENTVIVHPNMLERIIQAIRELKTRKDKIKQALKFLIH